MHRYYLLIQYARAIAGCLILFLVLQTVRAQEASRSFELDTDDGITVYGDLYEPEHANRPTLILAFHQGGGDGRGEYAPIIPRLIQAGYAVMSIDQRRGGDVFQGTNRTVAGLPEGAEYSYCDAYPDMKAALDFARTLHFERIIAWGSSYSAALVIKLAAEFPNDIDKVMAFSPASGDPMAGCEPREPASRLTLPTLIIRPEKEAALEWVADDLDAFRNMGHEVYVSPGGSHGSSVLVETRTGASTEDAWTRVLSFLGTE